MTKQIVVGNFISPHFIDQFLRPTLKNCLPFFPFSMQFSYTFSLDGVFSFSLPLNHLQCPCITNALAAQFENGRLRLWHCREQRRKILNVKRKPSLRVEQGNETLNSIACACAIMKKSCDFYFLFPVFASSISVKMVATKKGSLNTEKSRERKNLANFCDFMLKYKHKY